VFRADDGEYCRTGIVPEERPMPVPHAPATTAVLAAHGIAAGPAGYAWADLAALATARGWRVTVESIHPRPTKGAAHRAMVHARAGGRSRAFAARGRGPTEEAALAMAMASALARQDA
jgi:hypothetical protein